MSLESALAEENDTILRRLDSRHPSRGRERSHSPHSHLRSTSRSRGRGRSSSRRPTSRARSEDANFKWSILNHNPMERLSATASAKSSDADALDEEISEEEQVSDDNDDLDYDINGLSLTNFKSSINDYYKAQQFGNTTISKNLILEEKELKKHATTVEGLSEVLAAEEAIRDAKDTGNEIPKTMIDDINTKLRKMGLSDKSIQDLIELENNKDYTYDQFKQKLIEESHKGRDMEADSSGETNNVINNNEIRITSSALNIHKENLSVSRSVTYGDFFRAYKDKKSSLVRSYLIYIDLSTESMNAMHYTIGSVVGSGDVLYVIYCDTTESDIKFYSKQCEKLTQTIVKVLDQIKIENFNLHVVVQCLNQSYPKHFLNELIKYLKPVLMVTTYPLITGDLINYMPNIPLMVFKRKSKVRRR